MVTLNQLLTPHEFRLISEISQRSNYKNYYNDGLEMNILYLPIIVLHEIGLVLMTTEYDGNAPRCYISAEAINILSNRIKEKNLSIFD